MPVDSATPTPTPGHYDFLDFIGPMSSERADRIAAMAASLRATTILDLGCGSGELLLRAVAATDDAVGCGVDLDARCLERARATAQRRGLGDRATFRQADAATITDSADVVISIGARHAFGELDDALRALRSRLRPGGRLVFGDGFWERVPTDEEVAGLGPDASRDEHTDLAGLVDRAIAAGYRPLGIETATRTEWERFVSGFLLDWESYLVHHPDAPDADEVRRRADHARDGWLRGYRDVLGFAYLTLAPLGS